MALADKRGDLRRLLRSVPGLSALGTQPADLCRGGLPPLVPGFLVLFLTARLASLPLASGRIRAAARIKGGTGLRTPGWHTGLHPSACSCQAGPAALLPLRA